MSKQLLTGIIVSLAITLPTTPCFANGISMSPSFQELNLASTMSASPTTSFTYTNNTDQPVSLTFSLAKTMATDVLGRLKFNAPLPQTIQETSSENHQIVPETLSLSPGGIGTVSATFNTAVLRPGSNAFLLLANIQNSEPRTTNNEPRTTLNQYLAATIFISAKQGSTTHLELVTFDWNKIPIHFSLPDYFIFTLKNTGNANATPRGLIQLKDLFNHEISRGPINEAGSIILPGSQRVIYGATKQTQKASLLSILKMTITGYDATRQSTFQITKTFLYIHPLLFTVIPFFIVAVFFIFRRKKIQH